MIRDTAYAIITPKGRYVLVGIEIGARPGKNSLRLHGLVPQSPPPGRRRRCWFLRARRAVGLNALKRKAPDGNNIRGEGASILPGGRWDRPERRPSLDGGRESSIEALLFIRAAGVRKGSPARFAGAPRVASPVWTRPRELSVQTLYDGSMTSLTAGRPARRRNPQGPRGSRGLDQFELTHSPVSDGGAFSAAMP
jgi:hypothetical protein